MTSNVSLTAIYGAWDETSSCCYLLEIDDSKVLLDCGWDFTLPSKLLKLKEIAPCIDAVLLSHADLSHCGGYAYAVANLGLDCPCYATTPVHDMGLQLMQDIITSKLNQYEYNDLNLDQINKAFGKIALLRYSQPFTLSGKCAGIVITAFGAGHTVGGTVWKIKKDNEEIVYALDFNHRKESHLNGTVLLSSESLARPSLLITDSFQELEATSRTVRDEKLFEMLRERIAAHGNVLIPVETSTRVLELAYTLDEHWKRSKITAHLVFLSYQSQSTIVYAKSMLEWMSDSISQSFQAKDQPFDFRYLKCFQSLDEIQSLSGPKIVMTSFPSFDFGLGKELLFEWAANEHNCVIFPERPPIDSLGFKFYNEWLKTTSTNPENINMDIPMKVGKRVPLEGEEYEAYLENERIMLQETLAEKEIDLDDISDSDEEKEDIGEGGVPGVPVYDIYVKDHVNRKGFFKQSQAFRMFPVHEVRNRVDEYGEVLDLSLFSKFEQKVPEDDFDMMDIEMPAPEEITAKPAPSKYIVEDKILSMKCLVVYIDFEGRSDIQSIKNIINQLTPRKLMIVHGPKDATSKLAQYCRESENITDEIFTPAVGERISVSVATNLFQVILTDALVSSLRLSTLNDYNLAFVSGVIKTQETLNGPQLFLEALPDMEKKQRRSVAVGDVKLSELRRHLITQGFTANFANGGVLVVNGKYVIQKNAQGAVEVQGQIHLDFYKLRQAIFNFSAMLS